MDEQEKTVTWGGKLRRAPLRRTVALNASVAPSVKLRAERNAASLGLNVSAYVAALIEGQAETGLVAIGAAQLPALLGNRTVRALEALQKRIRGGEPMEPLQASLEALRAEITATLTCLRAEYDLALDRQNDPIWSGH